MIELFTYSLNFKGSDIYFGVSHQDSSFIGDIITPLCRKVRNDLYKLDVSARIGHKFVGMYFCTSFYPALRTHWVEKSDNTPCIFVVPTHGVVRGRNIVEDRWTHPKMRINTDITKNLDYTWLDVKNHVYDMFDLLAARYSINSGVCCKHVKTNKLNTIFIV